MIVSEIPGDALKATEEFLLVPFPVGDYYEPRDGFARQVSDTFPDANLWLQENLAQHGMRSGEIKIYEFPDSSVASYALAFAGIHVPGQDGWKDTPRYLERALKKMPAYRLGRAARIATAGIPGNGFNGLKGGADSNLIRNTLEASDRKITVYRRGVIGDRAPLEDAAPPPHLRAERTIERV